MPGAKPADEVEHVGVSPHPGGKALKPAQRLLGVSVLVGALDEPGDTMGVGPITFDGDGIEAALVDQALRDQGALAVELVRAV